MPRKILVDYNQVREVIKNYERNVKEVRDQFIKGHPTRERLSEKLATCDVFLREFKELRKYNSSGRKI